MSKILDILGGNLVKEIGLIIDDVVTSKEEKLIIKKEIDLKLMEFTSEYESEITKRHQADMASDNKFAKYIRPATLSFLLACLFAFAVTDGNFGDFTVRDRYIDLTEMWGGVAISFFFGSRGLEKIFKTVKGQ